MSAAREIRPQPPSDVSTRASSSFRGPAIEVEGLAKRYGDHEVLHDVTFEVRRGEVFTMLGPNGAGKTTTVEILEGFREPSAGTVRILGFDPAAQPQGLRERVGVVLQECGFPRQLRVGELLDAWRAYYLRPRPIEELLEVVDLRAEKNIFVKKLSGGQRRRLDFALALAGDPDLIFLDEPTTGFDPEARRRCWAAIENLRALGKTILLTTHYLDEAERLSDRVALLADGRITMIGSPEELARRTGAPTRISFATPQSIKGIHDSNPPEVPGGTLTNGKVVVLTQDPSSTLESLFRWTTDNGLAPLDHLAVIPPNLESVYHDLFSEQASPE